VRQHGFLVCLGVRSRRNLFNLLNLRSLKFYYLLTYFAKQREHSRLCPSVYVIIMLQVVSVTFDEVSLESYIDCPYDSVSLYDGPIERSPLLGKFCTATSSTFVSSSSVLFVVFKTDHSGNTGRFSLSWKIVFADDHGSFIANNLMTVSLCAQCQLHDAFLLGACLTRC